MFELAWRQDFLVFRSAALDQFLLVLLYGGRDTISYSHRANVNNELRLQRLEFDVMLSATQPSSSGGRSFKDMDMIALHNRFN